MSSLASAQPPHPRIEDVFRLMRRSKVENKYSGTVQMEVFGPNGREVYSKKVWADFPHNYHEEFIKKPANRRLLMWMKRRKLFHLYGTTPPSPQQDTTLQQEFSRSPRERRLQDMKTHRKEMMLRILRNFEPSVMEGDAFVGRMTYTMILKPRTSILPQMKFRIDKEFGTVLHFESLELKNDQWLPRYREYFTEIIYNPQFDEGVFPPEGDKREMAKHGRRKPRSKEKAKELSSIEEISQHIQMPVAIPENVPEGFTLERIRIVNRAGKKILHLHYSDGVFAFSLFQSPGAIPRQFAKIIRDKRPEPGEVLTLHHQDRTVLFKRIPPFNYIMVGNCRESLLRSLFDTLSPADNTPDESRNMNN